MKAFLFALLVFAVIFAAMVMWPGCISSGGGPKDGYSIHPGKYDKQARAAAAYAKATLAAHGYKCKGYGTLALISVQPGTHKVGGYWVVMVNGVPCRSFSESPRGWANRRQIVCVVPPAGQPDAGVLDDRIPRHEACHILLDACGITDTEEQHNIMRACGLY